MARSTIFRPTAASFMPGQPPFMAWSTLSGTSSHRGQELHLVRLNVKPLVHVSHKSLLAAPSLSQCVASIDNAFPVFSLSKPEFIIRLRLILVHLTKTAFLSVQDAMYMPKFAPSKRGSSAPERFPATPPCHHLCLQFAPPSPILCNVAGDVVLGLASRGQPPLIPRWRTATMPSLPFPFDDMKKHFTNLHSTVFDLPKWLAHDNPQRSTRIP